MKYLILPTNENQNMKRLIFSCLFVCNVLVALTQQNDPLNASIFTLKNGLTVMLTENHNTPQIFGVVAVKAGGKNDPKEATGMAHYLEHMLFKGTEELGTWDFEKEKVHLDKIETLYEELGKTSDEAKREEIQKKINDEAILAGKYAIPNEMDRMLSEIGGTGVNAFTTEDFTAYHNEFPANKLEQWLKIYDHRFEKPVFRLFQSELETVYEEKNRSMDSPFSEVIDVFNKNFWKNHPYGQQPIIGHTEHLKNPSLQKMYEYFDTYYVANNMVLALSGDFDTAEAKRLIELYFSDWRTGTIPSFPNYEEREFNGKEEVKIKATPIKAMLRGYRAPKNNHPDQKKIQIANYLLSNGEGSGLLDMLVTDGKLTYAGMLPMEYNDYSAAIVFAVPKILGQDFPEAEKLIDEQLAVLKKGEFDNNFFEGAKISFIKDFERQLETNDARALMLVGAFTSNCDWKTYLSAYLNLSSITKQDIMDVASKYYGDNFLGLYSQMGSPKKDKLSKPKFEPVIPEDGKVSVFCEAWRKTETPKLAGRFVDFEKDIEYQSLGQGFDLRKVTNPHNQIFTVKFSWHKGNAHDSILTYLPAYLNKLGTTSKSAKELKKALFEVGGSFYFSSTADRFELNVEGIDSKFDQTMELIHDFMNNMKLDASVIKLLAEDVRSERKLNNQDPGTVLQALSEYAIYKEKSRFLREFESARIAKLTNADFEKAFKSATEITLTVDYVGTKKLDEVSSAIAVLGKIKDGTARKPGFEKVVRSKNGFETAKVYFVNDKKAVQTQMLFLLNGTPMNLNQTGACEAFNVYFGADMSSLVFQEIREFRSLAYSTYARYSLAERAGLPNNFTAFIGCQGDKTPEAIQTMMDLIQNMPVKKEREEAIRQALISSAKSSRPGFRSLIATVDRWKEMGYAEDPNKNLLPYFNDFSFNMLLDFYQNEIKGKTIQLIVVGNSTKFDVKSLEKYGTLIKVKSSKILKN